MYTHACMDACTCMQHACVNVRLKALCPNSNNFCLEQRHYSQPDIPSQAQTDQNNMRMSMCMPLTSVHKYQFCAWYMLASDSVCLRVYKCECGVFCE